VKLYRLDLVGSSDYERGYGHGSLMAKEIVEFVEIGLSKYYVSYLPHLDFRWPPPRLDLPYSFLTSLSRSLSQLLP
jgi:hypothetical protein